MPMTKKGDPPTSYHCGFQTLMVATKDMSLLSAESNYTILNADDDVFYTSASRMLLKIVMSD